MTLSVALMKYVDFINKSLPLLEDYFKNQQNYLLDDWLQANWEIIVEAPLNVFLEPYGDGADCNGASSRVWEPAKLPTHKLMCRSSHTGKIVKFDRFARIGSGSLTMELPWNCAISEENEPILLKEIDFFLEKIN